MRCVFDGRLIASASVDGTIKVWDIVKWKEVAQILLPGYIHCVGFHPFTPKLVCCDAGGAVYRLNLLRITYGPIIVTPYEQEHDEFRVRCPACQYIFSVNQSMLGNELSCKQPECNTRLKVNSLTILRPAKEA